MEIKNYLPAYAYELVVLVIHLESAFIPELL